MNSIRSLILIFALILMAGCSNNLNNDYSRSEDPQSVAAPISEEPVETTKEELNEQTGESTEGYENVEEDLPMISEEALNHAYSIINGYDFVEDSYVEIDVQAKNIILAIKVGPAVNEEYAKSLGDNFARALSSGQWIFGETEGPTKDDLGSLYDYYDLNIVVGADPDNPMVIGAKIRGANKITW